MVIRAKAPGVEWKKSVALLFIDGLHDYRSVAADFHHFANQVQPGGFIAFHDYADYYPGVKQFVDELLVNAEYRKVAHVDSLIILQKVHEQNATN